MCKQYFYLYKVSGFSESCINLKPYLLCTNVIHKQLLTKQDQKSTVLPLLKCFKLYNKKYQKCQRLTPREANLNKIRDTNADTRKHKFNSQYESFAKQIKGQKILKDILNCCTYLDIDYKHPRRVSQKFHPELEKTDIHIFDLVNKHNRNDLKIIQIDISSRQGDIPIFV